MRVVNKGLSIVVVVCVLLCVSGASTAAPVRVCLDFFANPNHVPLFVAEALGYFADEGVEVDLFVPANPSDPVKLAAARAADVALTPQINYLIARSEGLPLMAIGALIDQGLGGLLTVEGRGVAEPADLAGKRIGYALAPLEPILWGTMLDCVGIDAGDVQLINVGFSTMQALLAGNVDAIGAFRNFEPIQAEMAGFTPIFFAQEAYCIPETYEIIVVAHPDLIAERGDDLAGFLRALARGIAFTREAPDTAFNLFLMSNPDLNDELNRRAFDETLPLYADGARHDDVGVWEGMRDYLFAHGLIGESIPATELLTAAWLPEARPRDEEEI